MNDRDNAKTALAQADAHGYLTRRDAIIETGKTGTSVNDMYVLVVKQ